MCLQSCAAYTLTKLISFCSCGNEPYTYILYPVLLYSLTLSSLVDSCFLYCHLVFTSLSFHINYLLHNNYNNASGSAWEQTAVETVPPMAVVVFSLLVCELLLWFINSAKPLCDKLIVLSPPSEYNLKPLGEA